MNYVSLVINDLGVATLTMARPEVHNAFDDTMIAELRAALASLKENKQARVRILRGDGRHFSAGADLNWMRSMAQKNLQENLDDAGELGALMWELDHHPLPTIALVQGAAFGGAVGLVACCDSAIDTERASFCLSETRIGLIPAVISPYVVRAMGNAASRRYMLTAERFDAATAARFGLVHEVFDALAQAEARVTELTNTLLNNSPAAVTAAKELVQHVSNTALDQSLVTETAQRIAHIRVSAEGQEGLSAFLEKRTANWVPAAPYTNEAHDDK